jgi:hypothetical protein
VREQITSFTKNDLLNLVLSDSVVMFFRLENVLLSKLYVLKYILQLQFSYILLEEDIVLSPR